MLVLSRLESQGIRIGNDIVITVVRIEGHSVRLGIDAPRELLILREEVEPHAAGGAIERHEQRLTEGIERPAGGG